MEGWEEILKTKFADEQVPLPEGDWEWFEANMLIPRLRRRRLGRMVVCAGALMAAALIALFVTPLFREPSTDVEGGAEVAVVEENLLADNTVPPVPTSSVFVASSVPVVNLLSVVSGEGEFPAEAPSATEAPGAADPTEAPDPPEDSKTFENQEVPEAQEIIDERAEPWPETAFTDKKQAEKRRVSISPRIRGIGSRHLEHPGTLVALGNGLIVPGGGISMGTDHIPSTGMGLPSARTSTHYIPVTFSLDVSVPLSPRLALTSGAELSYYHSRSSGNIAAIQNAFFLGVPLRLDWTITRSGPMSVYAGAGFKVDRLIHAQRTEDYDVSPNPFHHSVKIKDNRLNWSAIGDIGLQYNLSERVGLYVSPEVSYYFRPADPVITTYRNENPFMLSVSLGMKFDL